MEQRDFTNNGFYRFSVFFWNMVLSNLFFLLTNIPVLIVLLMASRMNIWYFQLSLSGALLLGTPGHTALYSLMAKLLKEKSVQVAKDYFRSYRESFTQSLLVGGLVIVFINILYIDILVFRNAGFTALNYIFLGLICFLFLLTTYIYPIIGRFTLRIKDVIGLSIYYGMKRFIFTLLSGAIFIILGYSILNISIFFSLIGFSLAVYIIMFYQRKMLITIEESLGGSTKEMQNLKIVAFGDSLTYGHGIPEEDKWTNILEKELGVKVINSGINGNTSAQGLARIKEDVLDYNPDIVLINFGMNDHFFCDMGRAKVSLEDYENNIREMIKQVKENGAAPILIIPHKILEGDQGDEEGSGATYYYGRHNPLWYLPVGGANEQLKRYCNVVRSITSEKQLPLVDMYTYTEDLNPHSYLITLENSTEEDGVHINQWGAEIYSRKIKEKLLELI